MTDTKVRRRSYSAMNVYAECPEKYRLKYVERIPEEPSVWSVGGTAFHTVAERYLRGQVEQAGLDTAWINAWYEAKEEQTARGADPDMRTWRKANRGVEDEAWWQENGLAMCRRFLRWWEERAQGLTVFELDGQLALEQRIEVDFGGVPSVVIPDAIVVDEHGQLNILDYKTGKPPKDPKQLAIYAAGLREAYGLETTWGLYYMARAGQLLPMSLDRYPHHEVVRQFVEFDQRERAGDYTPTPGDACRFCPYKRTRCTYYNPEAT